MNLAGYLAHILLFLWVYVPIRFYYDASVLATLSPRPSNYKAIGAILALLSLIAAAFVWFFFIHKSAAWGWEDYARSYLEAVAFILIPATIAVVEGEFKVAKARVHSAQE